MTQSNDEFAATPHFSVENGPQHDTVSPSRYLGTVGTAGIPKAYKPSEAEAATIAEFEAEDQERLARYPAMKMSEQSLEDRGGALPQRAFDTEPDHLAARNQAADRLRGVIAEAVNYGDNPSVLDRDFADDFTD